MLKHIVAKARKIKLRLEGTTQAHAIFRVARKNIILLRPLYDMLTAQATCRVCFTSPGLDNPHF